MFALLQQVSAPNDAFTTLYRWILIIVELFIIFDRLWVFRRFSVSCVHL